MSSTARASRAFPRLGIVLLGLSLLMLGLTPGDQARRSALLAYRPYPAADQLEYGQVVRVLDENTVLILIGDRHQRYDLLGLAGLSLRESSFAQAAQDALARVLVGEPVSIEHDPDASQSPPGRLAGYLYRQPDGLMVNLEMLRQGYCRFSPDGVSVHLEQFAYYADRARDLERGVWRSVVLMRPGARPPPQPADPPESQPALVPDLVYVTRHGRKYHLEGCAHLTDTARPVRIQEILETHEPCKTCRPGSD